MLSIVEGIQDYHEGEDYSSMVKGNDKGDPEGEERDQILDFSKAAENMTYPENMRTCYVGKIERLIVDKSTSIVFVNKRAPQYLFGLYYIRSFLCFLSDLIVITPTISSTTST